MITFYEDALCENCYAVRLLLHMLAVPYTSHFIELYPSRANLQPRFRAINPLAELPVIDDDGVIIAGAAPILVYLAARHAPGTWYATDTPALAQVTHFLTLAERLSATVGAARRHESGFAPTDLPAAHTGATRLLRGLDAHLWFAEQQGNAWLLPTPHPTIADLACFPHVILCEEGGISRQPYPALRRWCDRVKRLPNFLVMPGVFLTAPPKTE